MIDNFYLQVLESGVINLDNLHSLDSILDNLGRRHGRLKAAIGFKQCYWVVFRECALYNIRKNLEAQKKHPWVWEKVDEALILWRFLLEAIIERIEVRKYLKILVLTVTVYHSILNIAPGLLNVTLLVTEFY